MPGLMGNPQGITQSADGYIWVSTQNGLFFFFFLTIIMPKWLPQAGKSLPSSSMWHLFGARDGSSRPISITRSGSDQSRSCFCLPGKPPLAGAVC